MRPIDADALTKKLQHLWNIHDAVDFSNNGVWDVLDELESAPTIDAVEVVRCYKCIHWDENTVRRNSNDATWWNEAVCRKYSDDIWETWKDADWFCADGERRNDG